MMFVRVLLVLNQRFDLSVRVNMRRCLIRELIPVAVRLACKLLYISLLYFTLLDLIILAFTTHDKHFGNLSICSTVM